jgi:DNA-binding transcriptional ArsR family regulator
MARLFPLRSETPAQEGRPRVVDLADEDADAVFSALSSTTARQIYARLGEEPGTPSDVADAIDSSIQNVRYHLGKLEDAGLVEVVDTWYSSRGNEMSVYATVDGPLIVTSDESRATQLKNALSRFVGGVAALAGVSLLVQAAVDRFFSPDGVRSQSSSGDDSASVLTDASNEGVDTAMESGNAGVDAFVSTIPPGLLFFLGGLVVLVAVTAWWYRSSR